MAPTNDQQLILKIGELIGRVDSLKETVKSMDSKLDTSYERIEAVADSAKNSHKRIDDLVTGLKNYTEQATADIKGLKVHAEDYKTFKTRLITIASCISAASGGVVYLFDKFWPTVEKISQGN